MKKRILSFTMILFIGGTMFSLQAQTPNKESVKARENLQEAKKEVSEAKTDSIAEYQKFKKESEVKIAKHNKSIAEFKAKIAKEKKAQKAKNEKRLLVLENQNSELKRKLDEYKYESQNKWASFKDSFTHDMDGLGTALKNFTVNN